MKQGFVMVNILLFLWHFKNANNLVDHIGVLCQIWQWMRCYSIASLINECDTNEWNSLPNTTNVHGKKDFEPFECSSIFFLKRYAMHVFFCLFLCYVLIFFVSKVCSLSLRYTQVYQLFLITKLFPFNSQLHNKIILVFSN